MTKSKNITIGSVEFPLEDYAITGNALLGIRGAGKTYTAKGIAEQLLEFGIPIVVFDPIGQWQYLRRPGPGRGGKGFKIVVAGGSEPDLPLTPESAPQIVRAAIKEGIPLVVDLYDRKLSKADWRKIVQSCFRTLLYENEGVRHIFLEETAEFAPQKIQDGQTYAEVEKLVRMGGNASLGITLINQRAQEVNKAVLDLCENLVLMRQRGQHAIDALTKWLDKLSPDFAKRISGEMPGMGQGDAWVFAGEAEHPVRTRSATIRSFHPDRRKPELLKSAGASVSTNDFVSRLSGELETLVEKAKADDPKALKRRISELERALAKRQSEGSAALTADQREAIEAPLRRAVDERDAWIAEQDQTIAQLRDEFRDMGERCKSLAIPAKRQKLSSPKPATTPQSKSVTPAPRTSSTKGANGDVKIKAGARRMLAQLVARAPAGWTKPQIGVLTKMKHSSGTFRGYLSTLRTNGLIEERDGLIFASDAGIAYIGEDAPAAPTSHDEAMAMWRRALKAGAHRMLEAVADAREGGLTRDQLAASVDMEVTSGTFRGYLSTLRTNALIEVHGDRVVASDLLFP